MPPDYSKELQLIVDALSHSAPWWQPWLMTVAAAVLGVLGGFFGQMLLARHTAHTKLRTMRRMAYSDATSLLAVLDVVHRFPDALAVHGGAPARQRHFKIVAPGVCSDFIRANPEAYADLDERPSLEVIHNFHHQLLECEPDDFDRYLRSALQIICTQFEKKRFTVEGIKKHIGKEEAKSVQKILDDCGE